MTAKEKAKGIRKKLKEKGITSRQVSVRTDHGSINCHIKDLTIPKELVEKIAQPYEHVRRCEYSGDILSGGNTFVFVSFDWQALDNAAKAFMARAETISQLPATTNLLDTNDYWIVYTPNPNALIMVQDKAAGTETRYAAHNAYAIANALALLHHQQGINI